MLLVNNGLYAWKRWGQEDAAWTALTAPRSLNNVRMVNGLGDDR